MLKKLGIRDSSPLHIQAEILSRPQILPTRLFHQYKLYLFNSNVNASKEVSQWLSTQLSDLSDQVTKTPASRGGVRA